MIFTPDPTSSSATCCALSAGTAITPTMMFFSRTAVGSVRMSPTSIEPIAPPTFSRSLSKTAAMLIPCSAKIGDEAIASPNRPAPTVTRSVVAEFVPWAVACDRAQPFCQPRVAPCVRPSQARPRGASLCSADPSAERVLVHVVHEDALAVDLDDGDQLAVARLQLGRAVDRDLLQLELELLP